MKQIKNLIFSLFLLTALSCSDGSQVVQKVNQLIKENSIESIVVLIEAENGQMQKKEIKIDESTFEDQFIQIDGEYINMGRIKSLKVVEKKLEIRI